MVCLLSLETVEFSKTKKIHQHFISQVRGVTLDFVL